MKKLYILSMIVFASLGHAQINFPDPNLKAALLQANSNGMNPIDANGDGEISIAEAANVFLSLDISDANISNLSGLEHFFEVTEIDASGNQITTIDLSPFLWLERLNLQNNLITEITINTQWLMDPNPIRSYDLKNNPIETVNVINVPPFYVENIELGLSEPPANFLVIGELRHLSYLGSTAAHIEIPPFDIPFFYITDAPNLTHLNLKNGHGTNFYASNVPNLSYICTERNYDDDESGDWGDAILIDGLDLNPNTPTNIEVNRYCTVAAGGDLSEITGTVRYDSTGNGCDGSDQVMPNVKYQIDGSFSFIITTGADGSYNVILPPGNHTISPMIGNENNYFSVTPTLVPFAFPVSGNVLEQDFCVTPNGTHPDLEVAIIPLGAAMPGFNTHYKLLYKNKGTVSLDGTVNLLHGNTIEFVSSETAVASQTTSMITWNFTNLQPFEQREIIVVMSVNSPQDTPAVNDGDILNFTIAGTHNLTEETLSDNTATLAQTVINSIDPNDKTCLEGNTVGPEIAGKYVHYQIRFENTGTANAQNIVVKDEIDAAKFDVASLVPLDASHGFYTRINGNKVEFIFENIQLPFDDANNDGYVMFKIKTKPNLQVGDSFSNSASIYFDYNHPIVTEPAVTTIQLLGTQDFDFASEFALYPNPANDVLHIQSKSGVIVNHIEVYNMIGQIVLAITDAKSVSNLDVAALHAGSYFVKFRTEKGASSSKFIKQ